MARRLLVPLLGVGRVGLPSEQAHHARDVLRMGVGDEVELFTAGGEVGEGVLVEVSAEGVVVEVGEVRSARATGVELTIASAVPKAARGDWMVEKLSELGVSRFVPLMTERSVVHPEGRNKIERWERLAGEAARQSRRVGVMGISELRKLEEVIGGVEGPAAAAFLSTAEGCVSLVSFVEEKIPLAEASPTQSPTKMLLLVGPEGGWTEGEEGRMRERGLTAVTLGATILRVETAAIAAAAVVAAAGA